MQVHRFFIFYLNIFLFLFYLCQQPSFFLLLLILATPEGRQPCELAALRLLLRLLFDRVLGLAILPFISKFDLLIGLLLDHLGGQCLLHSLGAQTAPAVDTVVDQFTGVDRYLYGLCFFLLFLLVELIEVIPIFLLYRFQELVSEWQVYKS